MNRVYYLGFARGGWLGEAPSYAKAFERFKVQGENWQAVGMSLLDLSQVDQDLKEWGTSKDDEMEIVFWWIDQAVTGSRQRRFSLMHKKKRSPKWDRFSF